MSHSPARAPSHGWLIANLLAQICFGLLAMTVCLPSMQEWGALFDRGQAVVQLSFSAYVVTYGAFQLVYGPLSDRHGRRGVLMVGLVLAGLGSVLAALAPSLETLIAARALQGAGSAAGMVVGRSAVQDLFQGAERTRVMAWIGMSLGLCPPTATLIGGQLHVLLGWQANFVLMAVLSVFLLAAAWWGLPAPSRVPAHETHWLVDMGRAYTRLARESRFWMYVLVLATTTAAFYAFLAGAPTVLGSYGVGPQGIGWYIMAVPLSYIVGNYLTSHWIRSKGERRVMALGQAATFAGLGALLALGWAGWQSPLAVALPMLLLGLGHGFLNPPALAGTVGVVPALAGSAAAVAGLLQQLMGAVGGYVVGLVSLHGTVNLGLLMTGFTVVGGAAHLLLVRRR
jgi:DHA1 family bicyclomycin/chloramphenicol resistance-like MFS transporter